MWLTVAVACVALVAFVLSRPRLPKLSAHVLFRRYVAVQKPPQWASDLGVAHWDVAFVDWSHLSAAQWSQLYVFLHSHRDTLAGLEHHGSVDSILAAATQRSRAGNGCGTTISHRLVKRESPVPQPSIAVAIILIACHPEVQAAAASQESGAVTIARSVLKRYTHTGTAIVVAT